MADAAEVEARFAKKIVVDPETGCHNWKPSLKREASAIHYGSASSGPFLWNGKLVQSARVAWEMATGVPLRKCERVYRTCGNTKCVNPLHMRMDETRHEKWKRRFREALA